MTNKELRDRLDALEDDATVVFHSEFIESAQEITSVETEYIKREDGTEVAIIVLESDPEE